MKRAFVAWFAVCCLLIVGCVPLSDTAGDYLGICDTRAPRRTAYRDIVFDPPDADALSRDILALGADVQAGAAEDADQRYAALKERYLALDSAAAQAYLIYCADVTHNGAAEAYETLSEQTNTIETQLIDLALMLSEQENACRFSESELAALCARDALLSPEVLPITRRERALEAEYERMPASFSVEYGGKSWTRTDIEQDETLSFLSYFELVEKYYSAYNARAGTLFLMLRDARLELAAALGFASYPAYRYAVYGRDYTPEEAAAFCERVKTTLVPLYLEAYAGFSNDLSYLYGAAFPADDAFLRLRQALSASFSPLLPAWDGMLSLGLYDTSVSDRKMTGSFTTYLSAYRAPYLYTSWNDTCDSVFTLVHEFGHFASYWSEPPDDVFAQQSLDLAEVDSQGLELLMMREYGTLFGRYAHAARLHMLLGALYAVIAGCMEDTFQQWAYANPEADVAALNNAYYGIAADFGFTALYGYSGLEWVMIDHTFLSPLYYISYAVSMTGALSLWQRFEARPRAALRAYLGIRERRGGDALRSVLQRNGVADPFAEQTLPEIYQALTTALSRKQ